MGGLLGGSRQFISRDDFIGNVVNIHGVPYLFRRYLGGGAFGSVYEAHSMKGGRRVAIKVIELYGLPPGRINQVVQTYLNEVKLLENLRRATRHVVRIYDFDFDGHSGRAYIVMELGGENLLTLTNRLRAMRRSVDPSIDPVMIKEFWRQMVSIVATLHSHSIIHMDLKPDNLILFGQTLKIADLGVSRKVTSLGQARLGTPFFSAPEVMQDMPGSRRYYGPNADVWSLGAILYFMVYGRPPKYSYYASKPPHGHRPHPDPYLNDVLRRTLVMNPNQRIDLISLINHPFTQT